ncbi:ArsR/SmtB family transcription factor [Catenulispora rubra]|uniref:ArsR/SmtB family transcription factor n=1 Tax=Catenulispora rubra TaxID=280293 RepID=UPI0018921001|nr:helix-turn-helix transcriptional regulator [Catenulispora rubra]
MTAVTGLAHPDIDDIDLSTVLLALADPHRRQVVLELARDPKTERQCATFVLPIAKSTKTHHWRVLRESGLVYQRAVGNGLYIRLREDDLKRRFPGLLDTIAALEA